MSIIHHGSPLAGRNTHRFCFCLLGVLLAAPACDIDPASVATPEKTVALRAEERSPHRPGHTFYPLTIGNRWDYVGRVRMLMLNADDQPLEDLVWDSEFTRELVGTAELSGREYVIERESGFQDSPFGDHYDVAWVWLHFVRQDRSGLFSADTVFVTPPAKAQAIERDGMIPGRGAAFAAAMRRIESRRGRVRELLGRLPLAGVKPGEVTTLQYPLHTGARWLIRNDPGFVVEALVEGHEVLELPAGRFPAWRVRILLQIDDPPTGVRVWYGTSGFLQMTIHDELEEDPDYPGSVRTIYDESEILHACTIDRSRGGRAEPAPAHP